MQALEIVLVCIALLLAPLGIILLLDGLSRLISKRPARRLTARKTMILALLLLSVSATLFFLTSHRYAMASLFALMAIALGATRYLKRNMQIEKVEAPELVPVVTNENVQKRQAKAVKEILGLCAPSEDMADHYISKFDEVHAAASEVEREHPLWRLNEVSDWELTYFVDWKDTESFVLCLRRIASQWNATLQFGVQNPEDEDFLDSTDVESLMLSAANELAAQGLTLWEWDTESDCYCGWITKSDAAPRMAELSRILDVDIRPGSAV